MTRESWRGPAWSERLQERDQIGLLLRRQVHLEALIVERHDLLERRRRTVMEVRRSGGQTPENRSLDAVQVRAVARQQRLPRRSEEHTSELQSRRDLVCRLL